MMRGTIWPALMLLSGMLLAEGQQPGTTVASVEALIHAHRYEDALQATQAHLKSAPGDFRFWTIEGIIFSLQGRNPSAIAAFDRALSLSPDYGAALRGKVQLLYQTGDARAIPLLERVLKNDPSDLTAHEMLALLDRNAGQCENASKQFAEAKQAIERHPASLEAYGYCLVQLQRFEASIPVFQQLAALLSKDAYPKYDLAVVLAATKQYASALDVLGPLLTPDEKDTDVLSLASEAYEATGDTPKAVALLRQAIVLDPTHADYYVEFAAICLDHDSFQVGIDMLTAGIEHIPNSPSIYLSRGLLYAQLAEYDQAESDFRKAEQLDSKQTFILYARDLSEMQRDNPEEALSAVRAQLKSHPDSAPLNFLKAKLIMNHTPDPMSSAYAEAMKADLLAIKLKPDFVDARDLLANMEMTNGQYQHVIEQSQLALHYAPTDEAAMYHLLIALRHTGHRDDLKPLVKQLADLHQQAMKKETDRKRFRLVEQPLEQQDVPLAH